MRQLIIRAIHRYELTHVPAPLNVPGLTSSAATLVNMSEDNDRIQRVPALRFALACGPVCQLLRPAELEDAALADAIQQCAVFGLTRLFRHEAGVRRRLVGEELVLEQFGRAARISLSERGDIGLTLPLDRNVKRTGGPSAVAMAIIEEEVVCELAIAIAFCAWILEFIDPTQRVRHVAMAAMIQGREHLDWRTRAEQTARPNLVTVRKGATPSEPSVLDRPRVALAFDALRLAEDLMVPLRRQWKACT